MDIVVPCYKLISFDVYFHFLITVIEQFVILLLCLLTVPSEKPVILNSDGRPITSIAGPYIEGSDAKLICRVHGGK